MVQLADSSATKVTLPFVEERLAEVRRQMGADFRSYGFDSNRHVLEAFLRHHHAQGVSPRLVDVDELFHRSTHESVKI